MIGWRDEKRGEKMDKQRTKSENTKLLGENKEWTVEEFKKSMEKQKNIDDAFIKALSGDKND